MRLLLTQYRNREMTQTEIQSAYIALLFGCRFVIDVCITQVTKSAAVMVSDIAVCNEAILHIDVGSMPLHTLHHLLQFGAAPGSEDSLRVAMAKLFCAPEKHKCCGKHTLSRLL